MVQPSEKSDPKTNSESRPGNALNFAESSLDGASPEFQQPDWNSFETEADHRMDAAPVDEDAKQEGSVTVEFELGRASLEEFAPLSAGASRIVALDKLAGDPVDIIVDGRLVARGEILVSDDRFCVRIAELISGLR